MNDKNYATFFDKIDYLYNYHLTVCSMYTDSFIVINTHFFRLILDIYIF